MAFVKDAETRAVINTDDSHYQAILAKRQLAKENKEMARRLQKIDQVESELHEIKQLLQILIGNCDVKSAS